ncbi:MAG TPA: YidB family protein [Candidatus Methylomirabilis sp.]|nr:YidB family protein [Candidatus Methylomirabilis sp.]
MGLLDDLLGGLAGQAMGGRAQAAPAPAAAGGGSTSAVLMALMPVVLAMLANRGSGGGSPTQANYAPTGGGGLGGLLGQVLGGGGGSAGMAGGLGGLLEQVRRAGFGDHADSWVGTGANQPLPPDAVTQIFGREGLEQISRHAGISQDEASRGLSQLLPEVVDRMTPSGDVPDAAALTNSVDDLARRLGLAR